MSKEEFIKGIRSAVEKAQVPGQPDINTVQAFLLVEILDKLDEIAASLDVVRSNSDDEWEKRNNR